MLCFFILFAFTKLDLPIINPKFLINMVIKKISVSIVLFFILFTSFAQPTHIVTDTEKKYKVARDFFYQNDFQQAYPLLKELVKVYPENIKTNFSYIYDDVNYFYIVCELNLQIGNAEQDANTYFNESNNNIRIQELAFHLGHYYYITKKYDKAVEYFNKAQFNKLSNDQLYDSKYEKAYSLFCIKNFAEAKPLFKDLTAIKEGKYFDASSYYYGFIAYADKEYDTAFAAFKVVEKNDEYNQVVPYYLAELLYLQNKKNEALNYSDSVLKSNTQLYYEANMQLLLGQLYFEKENYEKALICFEAYLKQNQKVSKEIMYDLSYCYYKVNNNKMAIEGFKQLSTERDSLGQNSMYLLGSIYLTMDDKPNARIAFQYCAYNNTNSNQQKISRFNYAKLSYELGFNDIGLNEIKNFLKDYPNSENDEEAKLVLVSLLANTNNFTEGLSVYSNIPNPTSAMQKVYAKLLFGKAIQLINDQQINSADEYLNKIICCNSNSEVMPYACFWKGELSYRLQKYDSSIYYLNIFLESKATSQGEANYSHTKYIIGYAYFKKEQFKQALNQFNSIAKELNSTSGAFEQDLCIRIADCNYMLKDYAAASYVYDKIIGLNFSQTDYALFQKAMIAGVKNSKEKIKLLSDLASNYPNSNFANDVQFEIALTYIADESFYKAIPYLKKLVTSSNAAGIKPKAYLKLGLAYYNNNDNLNAIDALKTIIKNYPKSDELNEAMPILKDIYLEEGTPDEYFAVLKENKIPININEADSLAYLSAFMKYENADNKIAITSLQNYLNRYPNGSYVTEANYYLGVCYEKSKDFTKAVSAYENVVKAGISDYYENATLQSARIAYFEIRDYSKSKSYFQLLLQNGTNEENNLEALRGLVRSSYQLKQYADANNASKDLLSRKGINNDDKSIAALVLGKSQQLKKDTLAAIESFKTVIAINKSVWGAEARYELAKCNFYLNNLQLSEKFALSVIKETSSYDYWVTKSYILLGDIFFKQKDYFNAKATYESVSKNTSITELKDEANEKFVMAELKTQESSKIKN